jgi:hypothetical protein
MLPLRFTKKKVINKKNKINFPTLDLTADNRASKRNPLTEEKRLEKEKKE